MEIWRDDEEIEIEKRSGTDLRRRAGDQVGAMRVITRRDVERSGSRASLYLLASRGEVLRYRAS